MTPIEFASWSMAVLVCGVCVWILYVLGLFGVRLTNNYLKTLKPEPIEPEPFPVQNPNNPMQTVGPIQRPPGMGPAPQPPMWPAQR